MASSVNFFFQGDFEKPKYLQISLTYQSYIEGPYLAPVFTSKPIIITLLCPEANPRDKRSQPIISFQLFFQEKSLKPNHRQVHFITVDSR